MGILSWLKGKAKIEGCWFKGRPKQGMTPEEFYNLCYPHEEGDNDIPRMYMLRSSGGAVSFDPREFYECKEDQRELIPQVASRKMHAVEMAEDFFKDCLAIDAEGYITKNALLKKWRLWKKQPENERKYGYLDDKVCLMLVEGLGLILGDDLCAKQVSKNGKRVRIYFGVAFKQ